MEPIFGQEIRQMMYIAGETQEISTRTVKVVENIIRDQVVHILQTVVELATRRGSRAISRDDIIFQFRHDVARVERIRAFLAWKTVRKTAREASEKDNLAEEADLDDDDAAAAAGSNGAPAPRSGARIATVAFPWENQSFFAGHVSHITPHVADATSSNAAALEKLRENDERTRNMTVAEYATWSEYRHASLTYRRAKRFREWCGRDDIVGKRPIEDVMDILGFLTSEMVQNLTAEALRVQQRSLLHSRPAAVSVSKVAQKAERGLFAGPELEVTRKAIDESHVRMAFQRSQERPRRRGFLGRYRPSSSSLSLI